MATKWLHSFHQFFYRRPQFNTWVKKICWRKDRLPTPVFLGIPFGSAGKESTCNVGHLGSIPGLGRSPGEGNSYPLQYSGLENSMACIIHGVTKSWTQLSHFHFHFLTHVKPQIYHIPHRGFLGSQTTSTQTRTYVRQCLIYVGLYCLSFICFIELVRTFTIRVKRSGQKAYCSQSSRAVFSLPPLNNM